MSHLFVLGPFGSISSRERQLLIRAIAAIGFMFMELCREAVTGKWEPRGIANNAMQGIYMVTDRLLGGDPGAAEEVFNLMAEGTRAEEVNGHGA